MSRLWIWIRMSLPTLALSCALLSFIASLMPREASGEAISGSGLVALPVWCLGSLFIAGVMFLIGRALISAGQQDEKKKNGPLH